MVHLFTQADLHAYRSLQDELSSACATCGTACVPGDDPGNPTDSFRGEQRLDVAHGPNRLL
jgi:hypothetical protein